MIELAAIACGSHSQEPAPLPRGAGKKVVKFPTSKWVFKFLADNPEPEVFPWVVSWSIKESKFQEFQDAWTMNQDKDQI